MSASAAQPELSVVILCYRAEEFAPVFVGQVEEVLKRRGLNYELVLVANYKKGAKHPDRTPEIVRKLAAGNPRLTVVAKEKEGMMGWDMRTGFAAVRGKAIAVIDGDGQMSPEDIVTVYDILKEGKYVFVKTYREKRFDGIVRLIISTLYNFLLKLLFPEVQVRDANSKPKVFTRDALESLHLTSDDWFIDAEMVIKATAMKLPMTEVPTKFFPNLHRASFIKIPALFEFVKNLFRYRLKTSLVQTSESTAAPPRRSFAARVRRLIARHRFALIAAALLSLLVSAPVLLFPWYAGSAYRGINIPHFGTDAHMYLSRAKDALEGHPLGSPVLREGKDLQDTYFMYDERALAFPLRALEALGLPVNIVTAYACYTLLFVFILALLIYAFALELSGDVLLSIAVSVSVIAGYHIVYKQFLFDDMLMYARPVFPILSSLVFFIYLNLTVRFLRTRTRLLAFLSAVSFGLLFYVYFFAWTFALALQAALLLVYAFLKRDRAAARTLLYITLGGLSIGAYNLFLMWRTLASASGPQTSYFHWSYHTHAPILNLVSLAALALFVLFAYRRREDPNLPLIASSLTAFFAATNQQVVTGRVVQIGHYHWYFIVPLSIILGLYMLWRMAGWRAWVKPALWGIIILVAAHAIVGQYRSFFATLPGKLYEQTYRPIIDALSADARPGVILAAPDHLPYLFTIYTDHDLFWHYGATETLVPFQRFIDGLYVNLFMNKDARNDVAGFLAREMADPVRTSIYKDIYRNIEGFYSGYDFYKYEAVVNDQRLLGALRTKLIASLAAGYAALRQNHDAGMRALLSKYGVNYVVVDANRHPEWDPSVLPTLTEVVSNDGVSLYRIGE